MEEEKHNQQDEFIRERLNSNLEAYTNNAVLNKLTPGKSNPKSKPSSVASSIRRSTTASKKSTPAWNKRYPKKNDSNIVTSPVKTIRQFRGNESSDEYDTTTTFDDFSKGGRTRSQDHKDAVTVNIPLQSSPKKPLRKGTPKIRRTKDVISAAQSPEKFTESVSKSKSKESKRDDTREDEETTAAGIYNSSKRLVTNSHINQEISNQHNADDDDDLIEVHHNSNNTLLSEIPSDILSPEKHIYPPENLRKSSSNIPSAKKTTSVTEKTSLLSKPFAIFTPPDYKTPHNEIRIPEERVLLSKSPTSRHERIAEKERRQKPNRGESMPPSLYPLMDKHVDEYDDEDDDLPPKKILSDITSSRYIEEERRNLSIRKREESEAISIFFDRSRLIKKSELSTNSSHQDSLEPLKQKKFSKISPRSVPDNFKDTINDSRIDSSFNRLNEFIRNPVIDNSKHKSNLQPLEPSTPSGPIQITKMTNKPTSTSSDRRSSRLLDLSQFDSSDEEPVPKLTIPLPLREQILTTDKFPRKRTTEEPLETSTVNKKLKPSLYPTIPSQTPVKRFEPANQNKQLYPALPPLESSIRISANMIGNVSGHIPNDEPVSKQKIEGRGEQLVLRQQERNEIKSVQENEPLGDSEHWNKEQWKCFFRAFKKFKRAKDLSIFNQRLLDYLRCDGHEIKLKIQFAFDYEDEIRKK